MIKLFYILYFVFFISLPQVINAQNTDSSSMPAQIFVTDVMTESDQLKVGETIPVKVSLVNQGSYTSSGFYVLLGFTDSTNAYAEYLYNYATTVLPLIDANSRTEVTIPIEVPNLKTNSNIKIQAQVFNTSGMPFGFGQSKDLTITNNSSDQSPQLEKINLSSIVDSKVDAKELVIQNIGISTSTNSSKLVVDVIFNGSLEAASPNIAQVIRDRWKKDGKASTTIPVDQKKIAVPTESIMFNIIMLDDDGKEILTSSETKSVNIGMNSLEFNIQIPDSMPNAVVKIQAMKGGNVLDEKTFSITNVQPGKNNLGLILGIVALVLLIAFFVIRKLRKNKIKPAVGLIAIALLFISAGQISVAQSGADAYVQTSAGTNTFEIYAFNEVFTLLSSTAGGVFDPGSIIPVTASMRGSTNSWGFSHNTYAFTLKTNGISSGKLGGCVLGPSSDPDIIEWAENIESDMSGDVIRTFNNTATGVWTGPVLLSGSYWQTGSEDFTHDYIRCTYTSTVEIAAPITPGRYKMDIESVFGGPSSSGSAPYPMIGAHRRGALYYYVRPSAPAITIATTTCADRVAFSWTAVTGATSYKIYRSTNPSTGFMSLGIVSGTATSYSDTSGTLGTTYYYRIAAMYDPNNLESSPSNTVSGSKTLNSCSDDRCSNISGTQTTPLFSMYGRDYFYSSGDDTLRFSLPSSGAGAACPIDMCANTEVIEDPNRPEGYVWNPGAATPYEQYSCTSDTAAVCSCSGRTYTCVDDGVTTNTPNAPQCALNASCSYTSTTNSVTFNFLATNVIGSVTNANSITSPIPVTGSGVVNGSRVVGNTGDAQTSTASCNYPYTNPPNICTNPADPLCDRVCENPGDPDCPTNLNPEITSFITTPIVEQGTSCVFTWTTKDMASCTIGGESGTVPNGTKSFSTIAGRNITKTLSCISNEVTPQTLSMTKTCFVKPKVREE